MLVRTNLVAVDSFPVRRSLAVGFWVKVFRSGGFPPCKPSGAAVRSRLLVSRVPAVHQLTLAC